MNFFKSILSDDPDPDPPTHQDAQETAAKQSHESTEGDAQVDPDHHSGKPDSGSDPAADGGMWSFGGLLKTLSTRSESVLETYRKDLQEFGSGLKKETELFREVASRAVKDLPNSVEVTAAIDGVIKSTAEIISQGKDTLLASSDIEPETPDTNPSFNSARYSRFEFQLIAIQNDPNTFVEPEDVEDFKKWKLGFDLGEKSEEINNLIRENGTLEGIYKRVVPNEIDHETFWCRYFYRVDKLKQQESVRAKLVKRAISVDDDEEELSWDVDDDDDDNEEQESNTKSKVDEKGKEGLVTEGSVNAVKQLASEKNESGTKHSTNVVKEVPLKNESGTKDSTNVVKEVPLKNESDTKDSNNVVKEEHLKNESVAKDLTNVVKEVPSVKSEPSKQDSTNVDEAQTSSAAAVDRNEENKSNADGAGKSHVVESSGNSSDNKKEDSEVTDPAKKNNKETTSEGKGDKNESGNDGDTVLSQKTEADEEDLDWDEIEDIEGHDDKKATSHVASSNRADLRKRLSIEEDDEDLTWD